LFFAFFEVKKSFVKKQVCPIAQKQKRNVFFYFELFFSNFIPFFFQKEKNERKKTFE
jgi:hypothetical protein